MKERAELQ